MVMLKIAGNRGYLKMLHIVAGIGKAMGNIMEAITSILRDWLSLLLLGLGISLSPHEYIGGLILALAGAAIARAWERDQLLTPSGFKLSNRYMLTICTAFFVAHISALIVIKYYPSMPIQLVMAASGFASRWVVVFALSLVQHLSKKGPSAANRIMDRVLPPDGDSK